MRQMRSYSPRLRLPTPASIFTAPPPDRISYLIAPRAVELPREAALFLEDLRWELQQHPDVVIYF